MLRFGGKVSEGSFHLLSQKDGGARVVFLETVELCSLFPAVLPDRRMQRQCRWSIPLLCLEWEVRKALNLGCDIFSGLRRVSVPGG